MKEPEMARIAEFIERTIASIDDEAATEKIKEDVKELTAAFPLYAERRGEYKRLHDTGAQ